jgi:glycosyltransferase involved in cell wall biosynthesis
MRILLLTPGTGSFLCGSCTRDNSLGAALERGGHESVMVPLYLPFELEEGMGAGEGHQAVGKTDVRMGGINVFLLQKARWWRHLPRFVHDWLDSPALLRWASTRGNMTDPSGLGEMTISMLMGEEGRQAQELEKLSAWLRTQPAPDVILLSNAMLIGLARRLRMDLGVPMVCTLQGEQPFLDALKPEDSYRAWSILKDRAREVDGFIAVSHFTGELMRKRLGLDPARVHVVQNGIDLEGFEPAPEAPSTPTIGFLARMCSDKGLPALVDAFMRLVDRGTVPGVRLVIVGVQLSEDVPGIRELETRLIAAGIRDRVSFHPNVTRAEKIELLQSFSLLSVPADYGESFGLYLLEAMACEVPVVQPRHGGFPELLEATGGGLLYDPAQADGLVLNLEELLLDEEQRAELGRRGREAVRGAFSSDRMAAEVAAVCARVSSPQI